ncbi:MAG TPA: phage holin family protein [Candidatus Baltobacteraceae bacterium]|jgi:putative membrane protein|nr:phage holin family protein [Candidatus Baltobacteraceae bacterium]
MHLVLRLLVNAVAFYLIARYVPGFHVANFTAALIAALIFGIVNAILRPIVLLVSLPFTILTLGIFVLIVNALMFWLTALISPGVHVDDFKAAFIGALIMMIVSFLTTQIFKSEDTTRVATRRSGSG